MGAYNLCLNEEPLSEAPEINISNNLPNSEYYFKKYKNQELYNEHLATNPIQTNVTPPSDHTNSTMFQKMANNSNPPTQIFQQNSYKIEYVSSSRPNIGSTSPGFNQLNKITSGVFIDNQSGRAHGDGNGNTMGAGNGKRSVNGKPNNQNSNPKLKGYEYHMETQVTSSDNLPLVRKKEKDEERKLQINYTDKPIVIQDSKNSQKKE